MTAALSPEQRALHGLPAPNPVPDAPRDVVLSGLLAPIASFGQRIADGRMPYALASEHIAEALYYATRPFPTLAEEVFDLEDEAAELLVDAVARAKRKQEEHTKPKSKPAACDGLPAYYPAITEPPAKARARQDGAIRDVIGFGARVGGARRELRRRRDEELAYLADPSPAEKAAATRRLHGQVAAEWGLGRRIPPASRVGVYGSQGTRKTAVAIGAVAGIRERIAVRMTEPTVKKCVEVAEDYERAKRPGSLPCIVIRGRTQPDPRRAGRRDDARMCARWEVAEKVAARGISPRAALCPTCPMRDGCGTLRQEAEVAAMGGVGLFLMATAGCYVDSVAPAADLFIGDEAMSAEEVTAVRLADLAADVLPYRGAADLPRVIAVHGTIEAVAGALPHPRPLRALREAGVTGGNLREAIQCLEPLAAPDPAVVAGLPDADVMKALDRLGSNRPAAALSVLRAVLREIDQPRDVLHGLSIDRCRPTYVTVSRRRRVKGIGKAGVLVLNGTGDPVLDRNLFGDRLEGVCARIERRRGAIGTRGKSYSRQSLTGCNAFGAVMPDRKAGAERLRGDVAAVASRMPGTCLVTASMAAEEALKPHLAPGMETAHYGDVRGKNAWDHCESGVIVGQTAMSVFDIEALARCHMVDDPEPFYSHDVPMPDDWAYRPERGWPFYATRMRRMTDGTLSAIEVAVHPDPRVQRVLEQVREAEVVQALDRTRPIENDRHLVLMNSLCLDVAYEKIVTHAELVAGDCRLGLAMKATGILPLGGADLQRTHPDLFGTARAAEGEIRNARAKVPNLQIEGLFETWVLEAAYRKAGQRGGRLSHALIDTRRHPDPRAALTALLGPLVWFEVLAPAGLPARPAAPLPAAAAPPRPIRVPQPTPLARDDADEVRLPVIPPPDWLPQRRPWAAAGAPP